MYEISYRVESDAAAELTTWIDRTTKTENETRGEVKLRTKMKANTDVLVQYVCNIFKTNPTNEQTKPKTIQLKTKRVLHERGSLNPLFEFVCNIYQHLSSFFCCCRCFQQHTLRDRHIFRCRYYI